MSCEGRRHRPLLTGWVLAFPWKTRAPEGTVWSSDTNPPRLPGALRCHHTARGAGLTEDNTGYLFVHRPQGKVTFFPGHCAFPPTLSPYGLEMLIKLCSGLHGGPGGAAAPASGMAWAPCAVRVTRLPGAGTSGEELPGTGGPGGRCSPDPLVTNLWEGCWQFFLVFHHLLFLIIVHNQCICFTCSSSKLVGPVVPLHC